VTLSRLVKKQFVVVTRGTEDGRHRSYRITSQGTQALGAKKELLAPLFTS
jgi:DNA-binding PadR family transcriptional regulator